jgi:hypothetical protein
MIGLDTARMFDLQDGDMSLALVNDSAEPVFH